MSVAMPQTKWGRSLFYWCYPVLYITDCLDNEGRPSHSKIMWTVAFGFAMALWVFCTVHLIRHAIHFNVGLSKAEMVFLLAYAVAMISTAGGLDGWKTYLKSKAASAPFDALAQLGETESRVD